MAVRGRAGILLGELVGGARGSETRAASTVQASEFAGSAGRRGGTRGAPGQPRLRACEMKRRRTGTTNWYNGSLRIM
jgi:hypothetical protein